MGRTSILAFLEDYEKRARDLWNFSAIDEDYEMLPRGPGAYIIRAEGQLTWPYPWGRSPVFYIGKADVLRDRLWDHWDAARRARTDEFPEYYYPVHGYEAAYAASYYPIVTWQGMTSDALEEELIGRFIRRYGARPVANNQTRWKRV